MFMGGYKENLTDDEIFKYHKYCRYRTQIYYYKLGYTAWQQLLRYFCLQITDSQSSLRVMNKRPKLVGDEIFLK